METSETAATTHQRAIGRLADYGLTPDLIAEALDLSPDQVRTTLTFTKRAVIKREDIELADAVRELAHKAINKANIILQFGTPDQRLSIIKTILPNVTRMLATQNNDQQELRVQLDTLFSEVRSVPSREIVVTEDEIVDVEPSAAS